MAVTLFAAGALFAADTGTSITPVIPANDANNDIGIMVVMCNVGSTFSTPTNWTQFGTLINSANQSTNWFWKRLTGSDGNPTSTTSATGSSTQGLYGRIYVFRGCVTSGTPFDTAAMAGTPTSNTTPITSGYNPAGTGRFIVSFVLVDDDNTWSSGNPPTLWASCGSRLVSTVGGDCMSDAISRQVATTSAVASVTIGTMSGSDYWRTLTIGFIPAPATTTGSISGVGTLTATGKVIVPRTGSITGTGTLTGEGSVPSGGGASDDFNRTDNADLGANWTPAHNSCKIASNRVLANTGPGVEFWNADAFNDDHFSEVTVYLNSSGFFTVGPACRVSTTNGGTYYYARACTGCGDIEIGKRSDFSGPTGLASGGSISTSPPVTPFQLRLEVEGNELRAYVNDVLTVSHTDTSDFIPTGTRAGIIAHTTSAGELDNWSGGNLGEAPVTATGSISGTGSLTATGKVIVSRTGSITGTSTLSATGLKISLGTGSIVGTGTLTGTGRVVVASTGSIISTGTLTGSGLIISSRTGSLNGAGVLTATGNVFTPGVGFTETWDYPDQSGFASIDLTWTINTGGGKIISNTARTEGSTLRARAEHDTGSNDVYAEAVLVHDGTENFFVGVGVRANASDKAFYTLQQGNDLLTIIRYQASGAFGATIDFVAHTDPVGPFTMLFTVVGSVLTGYINGIQKITSSDGTITVGERGGIAGYSETDGGVIWDDFVTGKVSDLPPIAVTSIGSISGTSLLTATSLTLDTRTGSLVGSGVLTATGLIVVKGTGSINGTGLLLAVGHKISLNTGSINAVAILAGEGNAFGIVTRTGSLVAIGTFAGNGVPLSQRTGSISSAALLNATGSIVAGIVQRSGAIFSTGTLTAEGYIIGSETDPVVHLIGISMQNLRPMCHVRGTIINPTIRMGN